MKRVSFFLTFCFAFALGVSRGEDDKKFDLIDKYKVPKGSTLKVICDAERGNLVYISQVYWGKKDLGHAIKVLHQPSACSKVDGDPLWRVVGEYKIPNGSETLKVICDAERGNIVYVSRVYWNDTDLGNTLDVVHQPEDCSSTASK